MHTRRAKRARDMKLLYDSLVEQKMQTTEENSLTTLLKSIYATRVETGCISSLGTIDKKEQKSYHEEYQIQINKLEHRRQRTFLTETANLMLDEKALGNTPKLFVHENGFGLVPVDAKPLTFCRMSPREVKVPQNGLPLKSSSPQFHKTA